MQFAQFELLRAKTSGSEAVCVAILDGPVDRGHSCFKNANLTQLPTLVNDEARP